MTELDHADKKLALNRDLCCAQDSLEVAMAALDEIYELTQHVLDCAPMAAAALGAINKVRRIKRSYGKAETIPNRRL